MKSLQKFDSIRAEKCRIQIKAAEVDDESIDWEKPIILGEVDNNEKDNPCLIFLHDVLWFNFMLGDDRQTLVSEKEWKEQKELESERTKANCHYDYKFWLSLYQKRCDDMVKKVNENAVSYFWPNLYYKKSHVNFC